MQLVFGCVQLARRRTNYVSTLFGTNFLLDAINFLDFWEQLLTHQRLLFDPSETALLRVAVRWLYVGCTLAVRWLYVGCALADAKRMHGVLAHGVLGLGATSGGVLGDIFVRVEASPTGQR